MLSVRFQNESLLLTDVITSLPIPVTVIGMSIKVFNGITVKWPEGVLSVGSNHIKIFSPNTFLSVTNKGQNNRWEPDYCWLNIRMYLDNK